jgi:hypothetical protein
LKQTTFKKKFFKANNTKITTMKKLIVSVFALAAVVFTSSAAININGTGNAELLSQLAISTTITGGDLTGNVSGGVLEFGKIGIGSTASVVKVSTTGVRTLESGDAGLSVTSTTPTAAGFAVTGGANLTYTLTLPANNTVNLTSGGNTLKVQDFTPLSAGTLNALGKDWFAVGASLEIPSAAVAGAYTGTFQVTIVYN